VAQVNIRICPYRVDRLKNVCQLVYNRFLNVILLILRLAAVVIVQIIFRHVVVNAVQIFIMQVQHVSVLNIVPIHVLVNSVMYVHHRIQLAVAMEHFVQEKIDFLVLVERLSCNGHTSS
jgi:hypothetical protein